MDPQCVFPTGDPCDDAFDCLNRTPLEPAVAFWKQMCARACSSAAEFLLGLGHAVHSQVDSSRNADPEARPRSGPANERPGVFWIQAHPNQARLAFLNLNNCKLFPTELFQEAPPLPVVGACTHPMLLSKKTRVALGLPEDGPRESSAYPGYPELPVVCVMEELEHWAVQAADWVNGWRHGESYPRSAIYDGSSPNLRQDDGGPIEYWTDRALRAWNTWKKFTDALDCDDIALLIHKSRPPAAGSRGKRQRDDP